jgi:hypothetical protein
MKSKNCKKCIYAEYKDAPWCKACKSSCVSICYVNKKIIQTSNTTSVQPKLQA